MKKIFYLLIVCAFFSCEKNEFNTDINQSLSDKSERDECRIRLNNPFTNNSATYLCDSFPNNNCFQTEMETNLNYELSGTSPLTIGNNSNGNTYFNSLLVLNDEIVIYFNDIINSSNIYPYISVNDANIVMKEILCQIYEEYNQLPDLTDPEEYYTTEVTYVQTDFPFSGPQNGLITIRYKIHKRYPNP